MYETSADLFTSDLYFVNDSLINKRVLMMFSFVTVLTMQVLKVDDRSRLPCRGRRGQDLPSKEREAERRRRTTSEANLSRGAYAYGDIKSVCRYIIDSYMDVTDN